MRSVRTVTQQNKDYNM